MKWRARHCSQDHGEKAAGTVNKAFDFLRVHVLAYGLFLLAFFAWKSYLTAPHQRVTVESLVYTTGPVKHFSGMASLPSGSRTGYWLMLEDPRRDFDVSLGIDYRDLQDRLHEGTQVTVGHSPEVDPAKSTAQAFSFKLGDKEYLTPDVQVRGYNAALDKQLRLAVGATAGGFLALAIVEVIRRKLRSRQRVR